MLDTVKGFGGVTEEKEAGCVGDVTVVDEVLDVTCVREA
jgi:hypothetical protein